MSDSKKCTKCGEEKPATPEFFQRNTEKKDGLRSSCKICDNQKAGGRYLLRRRYFQQYYIDNKSTFFERSRRDHQDILLNGPYGIYKLTNTKTGKIYIGETLTFQKRCQQHRNRLEKDTHPSHLLQETFNNGGQDFDEIFKFEILEEWDIERKQEFDSEKGKQCPKYKLLKEELKKREAKVLDEHIQQGHDLYNITIDVETHSSIVAEKDAIIAKMREYLEARDEQDEEEAEDEIPRMESSRRG